MNKKALLQHLISALTEEASAESLRQAQILRFLPVRDYGAAKDAKDDDEVVCPGMLLELELEGAVPSRSWCLLVPNVGGLVSSFEGQAVQVITPLSPLGEALLGKRQGERGKVKVRESVRSYKILKLL